MVVGITCKATELLPESMLISDGAIVDNGLDHGAVPLPVFRALLGAGVSGFSWFGFWAEEVQNYIEICQ